MAMQRSALWRYVVLVATLAIIFGVIPPAPARAIGVDLFNTQPAGWSSPGDTTHRKCSSDACHDGVEANASKALNIADENDATYGSLSFTGGNGCAQESGNPTYRYCEFMGRIDRASGVTSINLESYRILYAVTGGSSQALSKYRVEVENNGTRTLCHEVVSPASSGDISVDCDTARTLTAAANPGGYSEIFVSFFALSSNNASIALYSFEAYSTSQILFRPFEDYVYNLRLDHPAFQRVISWNWRITWDGTWWIDDEDETVLVGSLIGGVAGESESLTIQCTIVCGDDTYTIHVHEDGYEEVTYAIDSDANGVLIANAGQVHITFWESCYNLTTDQCADPLDGVADSMFFRFTLTPGSDPTLDYDGDMSFGRWDNVQQGCAFLGSPVTSGVISPGTYTQGVSAWDQSAGYFNVDGDQVNLIRWRSATDPTIETCVITATDVTTGGDTTTNTQPGPGPTQTPCSPGDLACAIGQRLEEVFEAVFGDPEGILAARWNEAVAGVHDALMEKLPFAYVVLAVDGVNAQLSRAALAVENSDDCEGVTITVPLYYGSSNLSASPSPFPINVLSCEGLEPTMGSSWYQAVRAMMDPALWILFGWSQIKRLQPKASLNG